MKVNKEKLFLLNMVVLALCVLFMASIPALAQTGVLETPIPPPPTRLTAASTIYFPIISRPPPLDLTFGAYEITQATQNLNNSVSLVAGKATVLRVYAQTDADWAVSDVIVSVSGSRNGSALPGSPLILGPRSVTTRWLRGDLNTSFNFSLPADWLSGAVTLQIRIDPNNTILEGNEANNLIAYTANFTNVPALDVKVVPISYLELEVGLS